jgi:hypothetical protein
MTLNISHITPFSLLTLLMLAIASRHYAIHYAITPLHYAIDFDDIDITLY